MYDDHMTDHVYNVADVRSIEVLSEIERFPDCWRFSEVYLSTFCDGTNRSDVLFYKARSMYREYNRQLPEMIEKNESSPGFEYKKIMREFCQKRILEVVRILTNLVNQHRCNSGEIQSDNQYFVMNERYHEMVMMLDKALLDYLVFNMTEVQTCLLCHAVAGKLIHSHYIPKSIIQEFVKQMGVDPGASIYIFSPTGHPSDWRFKSAAKVTFSMLCESCDNKILSRDENDFKRGVFDKVYISNSPGLARSVHTIPYNQYLLRFAAGLLFRNIAPLYSQVCAETGGFKELHHVMQACRSIVLEQTEVSTGNCINIFLLALPSSMPESMTVTPGWDKFVTASLSPYLAYKLFMPGKPMIPKHPLCCMVKIGVLLFVTSFDHDLEMQLMKCNSQSLILSESSLLYIPEDKMRSACIPEQLWWSLAGWAKKEVNTSVSAVLSTEPQKVKSKAASSTHASRIGSFIATELDSTPIAYQSFDLKKFSDSTTLQTVVANMLPPWFSLNFNNHNTLPEKVIEVPAGHIILLHQPFQTNKGAECYAVLAKLEQETIRVRKSKKKTDNPAYSWLLKPYVLIYLQQNGINHKTVIKVGFCISETEYYVEGALPGCPPKMIESPYLQEIINQVPGVVHTLLQSKGFLSLKSLLFWQESMRKVTKVR